LRSFVAPRWHVPQVQRDTKPSQGPAAKVVDDAKASVQHTIDSVTRNQPGTGSTAVGGASISTLDAPSTQNVRTPFIPPIKLVTNVLNAALAPFLNTTPGQPTPQNPVLWAVLGWVRRQVQDTPFGKVLLNRTPVLDKETTLVVDKGHGEFLITPSSTD